MSNILTRHGTHIHTTLTAELYVLKTYCQETKRNKKKPEQNKITKQTNKNQNKTTPKQTKNNNKKTKTKQKQKQKQKQTKPYKTKK